VAAAVSAESPATESPGAESPGAGPPPLVATYRLQLHPGFTLHDAAAVVPYLARLGVSHVYLSPVLHSAPGSTHGYDVVDHRFVDDELGGEEGFAALSAAARAHGLGVLLDIVPNHMATHPRSNRWWWDVLAHGPNSAFAHHFDIDWQPREEKLRDVVLVPVLGDQYGVALEDGGIRLDTSHDEVFVRAGEVELPLSPDTPVQPSEVEGYNADPLRLHSLLEQQHYRLAHWRTARTELDYRRFFDVTDLVGLRVEEPDVFAAVHQRAIGWLRAGDIQGLRVDHPDGLRDPTAYLEQLRQAAGPDAWLLVEKILAPDEVLPLSWPVDGTTGYEFVDFALGLLVEPGAEPHFNERYRDFVGETDSWEQSVETAKRLVLDEILVAELQRMTDLVAATTERHLEHRDHARDDLRLAVRELAVAWPVYRTYLRAGETPSATDRLVVTTARDLAITRRPDVDDSIDFVVAFLLGDIDDPDSGEITARFQQLTSATTAKGVEDTAMYRWHRFVAHNEVGGDPGRFAVAPDVAHTEFARTQTSTPRTMRTTSTHDTKRGADVRARLAAVTHHAYLWGSAVARWRTLTERYRDDGIPGRNLEYLLYQTLVGAWPIDGDRLGAYLEKAGREAKVMTSWLSPDAEYEQSVERFVEQILADVDFVADLEGFITSIDETSRVISLGYDLLLLAAPGVPDLYQGTELWDRSLVDPDNRRRVDFGRRVELLDALDGAEEPPGSARDAGVEKLALRRAALALRRRQPQSFGPDGTYRPLAGAGVYAEGVFAFGRGDDVVVVLTRTPSRHVEGWEDTTLTLPPGSYRDVLRASSSGAEPPTHSGTIALSVLLDERPIALLERVP
jgi:(1->4)-alpha-D-glucan 1-alpha-D-glucosylmutase